MMAFLGFFLSSLYDAVQCAEVDVLDVLLVARPVQSASWHAAS